jgi:hypothetical protein
MSTEMTCPGCGAAITSETQFCKECGAPVNKGREAILGRGKESASEPRIKERSVAPEQLTSRPGAVLVLLGVVCLAGALVARPFSEAHAKLSLILLLSAIGCSVVGALVLVLRGGPEKSSSEIKPSSEIK